MAGVLKAEDSLAITVSTTREQLVATIGDATMSEPVAVRHFPRLFLDPQLVTFDPPSDIALDQWTLKVSAGHDATLRSAVRGARRTLFLAALAATVGQHAGRLGQGAGRGDLLTAVLEFSNGLLVLARLSQGDWLALLARADADIGGLLYDLRQHRPAVAGLL